MSQQWLREVKLTIGNSSSQLDLSTLRVQFQVKQDTVQTPNIAVIRVTNPSKTTAQRLVNKEFTVVTLAAGYQGNFGQIFKGTLKQGISGRENITDTYVDLYCAIMTGARSVSWRTNTFFRTPPIALFTAGSSPVTIPSRSPRIAAPLVQ